MLYVFFIWWCSAKVYQTSLALKILVPCLRNRSCSQDAIYTAPTIKKLSTSMLFWIFILNMGFRQKNNRLGWLYNLAKIIKTFFAVSQICFNCTSNGFILVSNKTGYHLLVEEVSPMTTTIDKTLVIKLPRSGLIVFAALSSNLRGWSSPHLFKSGLGRGWSILVLSGQRWTLSSHHNGSW